MKKDEALKEIEKAITSHEEQLKTSRLMAYGMQVDKEGAALNERRCAFGRWLYDNMAWLKRFFGTATIEEIEKIHTLWHNENRKIYEIYSRKKEGRGLFGKLLGKKRFEEGDLDRAKAYYEELKKLTEELVKRMKLLLVRAKSRPEDDYEKIKRETKE
ncbi:CZB domain-containing protein [Hydrogenimonas urashimensis]|uniref:CZB domain-containing protein n=1 Tax=Hydrogenimonas urashimensis TaxID=2740515 RepID=UPI001916727B|nr:CZB domain-containing protein [Hydrogenimonas urashimensis]